MSWPQELLPETGGPRAKAPVRNRAGGGQTRSRCPRAAIARNLEQLLEVSLTLPTALVIKAVNLKVPQPALQQRPWTAAVWEVSLLHGGMANYPSSQHLGGRNLTTSTG